MSRKALFLVISMTVLSLAIPLASMQRDGAVDAEATPQGVSRTYTVTVDVESLRVISYLDDDGVQHPADSSLVPPVPVRGPREFTVGVNQSPDDSSSQSGRVERR